MIAENWPKIVKKKIDFCKKTISSWRAYFFPVSLCFLNANLFLEGRRSQNIHNWDGQCVSEHIILSLFLPLTEELSVWIGLYQILEKKERNRRGRIIYSSSRKICPALPVDSASLVNVSCRVPNRSHTTMRVQHWTNLQKTKLQIILKIEIEGISTTFPRRCSNETDIPQYQDQLRRGKFEMGQSHMKAQ